MHILSEKNMAILNVNKYRFFIEDTQKKIENKIYLKVTNRLLSQYIYYFFFFEDYFY